MPQETAEIPKETEDELEQLGIMRGQYDLLPLDGVRKVVASRLTAASRDIPTFPLNIHVNMEPLLDARAVFNEGATRETKVSINDFILKASGKALMDVPDANASFTPHGIVRHFSADVAMAVAIPGGLITPIVKDISNRSLRDIALATKDFAARAKAMKLSPDEYNGGTFCVSNLGMFGISSFGSIINPPQGAILSVGATEERIVSIDRQPLSRSMATMTMTCDHRVIDGAIGAHFLQAFKGHIESPTSLTA